LLVGSVVIDVELGRKNHGSIPATTIERRLEPFDIRTDLRTKLNWWLKQKQNKLFKRI
jgi:hypothetical protein